MKQSDLITIDGFKEVAGTSGRIGGFIACFANILNSLYQPYDFAAKDVGIAIVFGLLIGGIVWAFVYAVLTMTLISKSVKSQKPKSKNNGRQQAESKRRVSGQIDSIMLPNGLTLEDASAVYAAVNRVEIGVDGNGQPAAVTQRALDAVGIGRFGNPNKAQQAIIFLKQNGVIDDNGYPTGSPLPHFNLLQERGGGGSRDTTSHHQSTTANYGVGEVMNYG